MKEELKGKKLGWGRRVLVIGGVLVFGAVVFIPTLVRAQYVCCDVSGEENTLIGSVREERCRADCNLSGGYECLLRNFCAARRAARGGYICCSGTGEVDGGYPNLLDCRSGCLFPGNSCVRETECLARVSPPSGTGEIYVPPDGGIPPNCFAASGITGGACPRGTVLDLGTCPPGFIYCSPRESAAPAAPTGPRGGLALPNPLGTTDPAVIIGRLIRILIFASGFLSLLMFIYAGFTFLTAAGNPEKIKKGKDLMLWVIVGLTVTFSSYLVLRYIIQALVTGVAVPG